MYTIKNLKTLFVALEYFTYDVPDTTAFMYVCYRVSQQSLDKRYNELTNYELE